MPQKLNNPKHFSIGNSLVESDGEIRKNSDNLLNCSGRGVVRG